MSPSIVDLPPELIRTIIAQSIAHLSLSSRARSRRLSALSRLSRAFYHPANSQLYHAPALPKRCVWLLHRTLRHEPRFSSTITCLTVVGFDWTGSIIGLVKACGALRVVSLRASQRKWPLVTGLDWSQLFDALEATGVEELDWGGAGAAVIGRTPSSKGVVRTFKWPKLRKLSISDEYFTLMSASSRRTRASPSPAGDHPPSSSLASFSLSNSTVPYNFLDHLSSCSALTSLSLSDVQGISAADFERSLNSFGRHLTTLSILDTTWPSQSPPFLSAKTFALLPSLSHLTLSRVFMPHNIENLLHSMLARPWTFKCID